MKIFGTKKKSKLFLKRGGGGMGLRGGGDRKGSYILCVQGSRMLLSNKSTFLNLSAVHPVLPKIIIKASHHNISLRIKRCLLNDTRTNINTLAVVTHTLGLGPYGG